jgi:hypothetical protein
MASWSPIIQLSLSIRTGKYSVGDSTTITFDAFPDTDYRIILTPFVSEAPTGIPVVWVIDNKDLETITSNSFQIGTSGCDGAYWAVIYNSNIPEEGGGGGVGPPGLG